MAKQNWQDMMEDAFKKLPALPKGGRDFLVQVTPWLALIFGILGVVLGVVAVFGLGFVSLFSMASGNLNGGLLVVSALVGLGSSVLLLAAYPGTNKRKMQGWNMLFWSRALALLASVVYPSVGGIFWALVWAVVSYYLLYQIKSYYK